MKKLLAAIVVLSVLLSLTVTAFAKPTIVVWQTLTEERVVGTVKKLLEEYEQKSGNRTAFTAMPADPFWVRWSSALFSKTTPDVAMVMADYVQTMAAAGHLLPLDDLIVDLGEDDFLDSALDAFRRPDGHIYGVPAFVSSMNLVYRKDVFEAAGLEPPKTWNELLAASSKLSKNPTGLYGQKFGYTVPAAKNVVSSYHLYAYMRTNGADIFDEQGNVSFNSPETVETIKFLKKLYQEGSPPGSTGYSWGDIKESYWSGQAAMIAYYGGVTADMPKYAPELVDKTGVVPIPIKKQPGTHSFSYAWVIPKYTEYPGEVKAFIKDTLMDSGNHIAWLNSDPTDNLPPRKSLAEDPRFWDNPTIQQFKPLVATMLKSVKVGDVFAQGSYPSEYAGEILGSLVVPEALQMAISQPDRPVEDIVAQIDKEIREIVGQ